MLSAIFQTYFFQNKTKIRCDIINSSRAGKHVIPVYDRSSGIVCGLLRLPHEFPTG